MSASLTLRLALRRADGTLAVLPRFTCADDPLRVRAHLLAFYEMRDTIHRMRGELTGKPWAARERVQLALALDEVQAAMTSARDCLRTVARRGGRGFAPYKANDLASQPSRQARVAMP